MIRCFVIGQWYSSVSEHVVGKCSKMWAEKNKLMCRWVVKVIIQCVIIFGMYIIIMNIEKQHSNMHTHPLVQDKHTLVSVFVSIAILICGES